MRSLDSRHLDVDEPIGDKENGLYDELKINSSSIAGFWGWLYKLLYSRRVAA